MIGKTLITMRFFTALSLSIFDFISHKNFYERYIIDEGPLSESILHEGNQAIYCAKGTRHRNSTGGLIGCYKI